MAKRTKIVKVKGHYRTVPTADYRVVADPVAQQEATVPVYKTIYIRGYDKIVTYDDGTKNA